MQIHAGEAGHVCPANAAACDAQHAQARGSHRVDRLRQRGAIGRAEPAKAGDRFGGALGGDDEFLLGRRPAARYGLRRGDRAEDRRRGQASSQDANAGVVPIARGRASWNARSIGSNGSGALASRPNSLRA